VCHLGCTVSSPQLMHEMLEEQFLFVHCRWEDICHFDSDLAMVNVVVVENLGRESWSGCFEILSLPTLSPSLWLFSLLLPLSNCSFPLVYSTNLMTCAQCFGLPPLPLILCLQILLALSSLHVLHQSCIISRVHIYSHAYTNHTFTNHTLAST